MSVTSGAARAAGLLLVASLGTAVGDANAAATILLWPIDPWLGPETRATELWIQNQGNAPATMQVRIVRWRQEGGGMSATNNSRMLSPARQSSLSKKAPSSLFA